MILQLILFIAGLAGLFAGASLLVRGASRLALSLGIPPLVVGLTVVAFGTSAPEMAVSVGSVLSGAMDLAIGNLVGSNIFNVLFILGVSALIVPLAVHRQVIRQEAPIMVGSALLLLVLAYDGVLGLFDGLLLTGLLLAYTVFLIVQAREGNGDGEFGDAIDAQPQGRNSRRWVQLLSIVGGLVLLVAGSQALVSSATVFARALGVSDVVIGLTIVAAGTSLPEVAASVMAALRGQRDLAIGNVVGSCVFNAFGVGGLAALAALAAGTPGLPVPQGVRDFDLWVMAAVMVATLPVFLTGRVIARWEGLLFLIYYAAYTAYLVMAAQRHGGLAAFGDVMTGFVVPLTIVTLVASMVRRKPG